MFGKMKSFGLRTAAATTVQVALAEAFRIGKISDSPVAMAHAVVMRLYDHAPQMFTDKGHPLPHKLSIAAFALASSNTPELLPESFVHRMAFLSALGMVLEEIRVNGHQYPFHAVDMKLINYADERCQGIAAEIEKDPEYQVIDRIMSGGIG